MHKTTDASDAGRLPDRVRNKLLELENRRRIFERIRKVPGIHMRRLCRELCASIGTVEHHLYVLEKEGLVVSHRGGKRRSFYDASRVGPVDAAILHALRHRTQRCLLVLLLADPKTGYGELVARAGLHGSTGAYHLQRLRRAGLVVGRRVGRSVLYELKEGERVRRLLETFGSTFRGLAPPHAQEAPNHPPVPPPRDLAHPWSGFELETNVFGGLIARIPPPKRAPQAKPAVPPPSPSPDPPPSHNPRVVRFSLEP